MDGQGETRKSNVANDAYNPNPGGDKIAAALAVDETKPIAVIGMSCRFSGDSTDPEKLWDMLSNGRDGWSGGNKNRFDMSAFYHPSTKMSGTVD